MTTEREPDAGPGREPGSEPEGDSDAPLPLRRKVAFIAIAVTVSLVVAALLVELLVWLASPRASFRKWQRASLTYLLDDATDWKLEPRRYDWGFVNRRWLRGPEVPVEKAPGTYRIVVLGGSAAFDLYKREPETWSSQLAGFLGRFVSGRVEVVNGGTPGYSTHQARKLFAARLAAYRPDLVIVYELYNDSLTFRHASAEAITAAWKVNARANWVGPVAHPGAWDAFGRVLPHTVDWLRGVVLERQLSSTAKRNAEVWHDPTLSGKVSDAALAFYEDNLRAIAQKTRELGAELVIATQASLIREHNAPAEQRTIHYALRGLGPEELWKGYVRARETAARVAASQPGAHLVTTHELIPGTPQFFLDEVHLTVQGSRLLAYELTRALVPLLPAGVRRAGVPELPPPGQPR